MAKLQLNSPKLKDGSYLVFSEMDAVTHFDMGIVTAADLLYARYPRVVFVKKGRVWHHVFYTGQADVILIGGVEKYMNL